MSPLYYLYSKRFHLVLRMDRWRSSVSMTIVFTAISPVFVPCPSTTLLKLLKMNWKDIPTLLNKSFRILLTSTQLYLIMKQFDWPHLWMVSALAATKSMLIGSTLGTSLVMRWLWNLKGQLGVLTLPTRFWRFLMPLKYRTSLLLALPLSGPAGWDNATYILLRTVPTYRSYSLCFLCLWAVSYTHLWWREGGV